MVACGTETKLLINSTKSNVFHKTNNKTISTNIVT